MTKLGVLLAKRSVNQSDLGRRIGVTRQRINKLMNQDNSVLSAKEMYLISLALEISIEDLSEKLFGDEKLTE